MNENQISLLDIFLSWYEYFFLAGSTLLVVLMSVILGPVTAVKGGYLVIGAAILLFLTTSVEIQSTIRETNLIKTNVTLILVLFSTNILFEPSLMVITGLSFLISFIIALNILNEPSPSGALTQGFLLISLLLTISVLNSGMIIGNIDPIWHHYPNIKNIMGSGEIKAISSRYQSFPILFILTTTVGFVTDLSPYPTVEAVIFAIGCSYIFVSYFFAKGILQHESYIYYPILVPSISLIAFHIPIFFPQTLAILLALLVFAIGIRRSSIGLQALAILIGGALILTHHLTIFIFMIPIIPLYLGYRSNHAVFIPIFLSALSYWIYVQDNFIVALITSIYYLIEILLSISSGGESTSTILLGVSRLEESISQASIYLISYRGIYFSVLIILTLSGLYYILEKHTKYGLGIVGIITGALLFPLPFSVVGLLRSGFALSFFFIPIVCLGIFNFVKGDHYSNIGVVLTITFLCALSPLIAIGYHPIYDGGTGHDAQYIITEGTTQKYEELAQFSQRTETPYRTMRISSYLINYFGGSANQDVEFSDGELVASRQLFLYRMSWAEQRTSIRRGSDSNQGPRFTNYLYSEEYLEKMRQSSNVVYSSGDTGLLMKNDGMV
jgi:hypothetical protein